MKKHTTARHIFALVMVLVALGGRAARAHDPLEITATVYFRSNQVELFAEMESRPARVLAGAMPESSSEAVVQKMNDRAADYFKLWSDEESLAATSATATPGVENHVQLRLLYPRPAGGAFKVEAPLLVTLAADGAYGVSLTLLDMVNQKVVGQSVLLAGSSTSPLLSVTLPVASNAAPSRSPSAGPPISADADIGSASEGDSQPGEVTRMNYRLVWWLLAGIFAACILWRVVRLNKAHDKQQG